MGWRLDDWRRWRDDWLYPTDPPGSRGWKIKEAIGFAIFVLGMLSLPWLRDGLYPDGLSGQGGFRSSQGKIEDGLLMLFIAFMAWLIVIRPIRKKHGRPE